MSFYNETQKQSVGKTINDAGYRILQDFSLAGKRVLEIGPGTLPHERFWNGKPAHYTLVDLNADMLSASREKLQASGTPFSELKVERDPLGKLPFADNSFDVVISFYSLEHLYPLEPHVKEMHRVLRPGGIFAGGIPSEGGLAWGAGRFLTSRRWLKRNTGINPDKLICWEHPNFADHILATLDQFFVPAKHRYWPLRVPSIDINLIVSFIYIKPETKKIP